MNKKDAVIRYRMTSPRVAAANSVLLLAFFLALEGWLADSGISRAYFWTGVAILMFGVAAYYEYAHEKELRQAI